jgi:membrane-associated protease RseP (regulator of RpoE activity)
MLWSGEEQGLLGSRAWTQKHKAELEKYSACLVHDGGTNYLSGIAGMKEMHPQLETVFAPVMDLDPAMPFKIRDIEAFTPIGSDHESFWQNGVPGFFWGQAGKANYNHTHHTQYDTYDAAIPEYQMHSSVVIATGALGLANLPELLTRENMKTSSMFGGGGRGPRAGRTLGVNLEDDGVTIAAVEGDSPAAKAGVKAGDKVLKVGDKPVKDQRELRAALDGSAAKTTVTVKRGDKEETLPVTFGG